jgi:hypothetical protein
MLKELQRYNISGWRRPGWKVGRDVVGGWWIELRS